MCADAYVFTCTTVARVHCKFPRISCFHHRQLRYQACASAFIPSVVGLRLPFPLFVIVPMLSLSCPGWLLEHVPAAVEDGLLRLCEVKNCVLPPLGKELRPDHPLLC